MSETTDQISSLIPVPPQPQRIISLVPSITELLFDLGLEDRVAGITKFCVHPEHWFRTKTRVGGTKTIKIDTIQSIVPDLIIANKEENVKEQIGARGPSGNAAAGRASRNRIVLHRRRPRTEPLGNRGATHFRLE